MKKLLALSLLIGIYGCTSSPPKATVSIDEMKGQSVCVDILMQNIEHIREYRECMEKFKNISSIEDYSENVREARLQSEKQIKLEEELLKAQTERIEISNSANIKNRCINILAESIDDYPMYLECMEKFEKEYAAEQMAEVNALVASGRDYKKQQEEKRLAIIHALKERCISYGFTGNNNIAACVQREAKHDYEIEQKDYELELARQQIIAQQNQQPVPTEVPWYLSILEAVSEGIAEGYERKALIQSLDARYQRKDIYRYCRPNC